MIVIVTVIVIVIAARAVLVIVLVACVLRDLFLHLLHVERLGLRDELLERGRRQRAGLAEQQDAVAEQHERRDRLDPAAPASSCCASVSILPNTTSRVRIRGLLEDRRERAAGPAPLRPEVEQDDAALLDRVLEVVCRDLDGRHITWQPGPFGHAASGKSAGACFARVLPFSVAKLRITYNAPVVLTFTIAAVVVFIITRRSSTQQWFVAYPQLGDAPSYVGLFTHILGHASWEHLLGNFMLILLIGPILEERHGSLALLVMILVTALVTGLANLVFSSAR